MLEFIRSRIGLIGEMPICNLNIERAFFIGNFCFPLCVRCSAIVLGVLLTVVLIQLFKIKLKGKFFVVWILLIAPCLIDGIMQYGFGVESTNLRRLITGLLSGVGIGNLINVLSQCLFRLGHLKTT